MYYPYLRAKQMEMQALVQVAPIVGVTGNVLPILEVVDSSKFGSIVAKCLIVTGHSMRVALIMNPRCGNLCSNHQSVYNLLSHLQAAAVSVVPALISDAMLNAAEIARFLAVAGNGGIVVHMTGAAPSLTGSLMSIAGITHIEDCSSSGIVRTLRSPSVCLVDGFRVSPTNAGYPAQSFFTTAHRHYAAHGYSGVGDFTIVGSRYRVGGGPATNVAIHLTEGTRTTDVYCNHFKSIPSTTTGNQKAKVAQALNAVASYDAANPGVLLHTSGLTTLLQHVAASTTTSLSQLKRHSIAHHIELMSTLV